MNLHALLLTGGIAITASTLYCLRREHLRAEYSVGWLLGGLLLLACGLVPGGIAAVSAELHLDLKLLYLVVAGLALASLMVRTTREVSQLWDEKVRLAQRTAILEYRMRKDAAAERQRQRDN